MAWRSWLWVGLAACAPLSSELTAVDKDGASDSDVAPADKAVTTDTDPADPGPEDTDQPDTDDPEPEPEPEPEHVVQFVAMGDGGEGNPDQYTVSDVVEAVCGVRGCDFVLYLGDNIYDSGVDGVDDTQFLTKFEAPYANLDLPFYVVLGNHDYGGDGAGWEFWKGEREVEYSQYSDKWTMPDNYYSFETSDAMFIGLDTNLIFYGLGADQRPWIEGLTSASTKTWSVAFGHHPYISNGPHGTAGRYEGIPQWVPLTEIPRGEYVRGFMEDHVCHKVDLYISGHDHSRQWLEPKCGTEWMVSGSAAKTTDIERDDHDSFFESGDDEGFVWIELRNNVMTAAWYDKHGVMNYEGTLIK